MWVTKWSRQISGMKEKSLVNINARMANQGLKGGVLLWLGEIKKNQRVGDVELEIFFFITKFHFTHTHTHMLDYAYFGDHINTG